ncbi:hypothetical protein VCUG_02460 [Vavraia culicis subsp. floridensis]|uniref:Uncharacterized protein n=1 Tax=Vavraia culicis (isolate floridensis) TaxID=948595 RepID=L2GRN8_VAVCU|nr:uncharacterized protein VCUG_02460 [Vavraia culicis subsp. floridensis]ELA46042.1 hypothetical protein VCUG_02460 [Vavraia culicis subsp. floridensis]
MANYLLTNYIKAQTIKLSWYYRVQAWWCVVSYTTLVIFSQLYLLAWVCDIISVVGHRVYGDNTHYVSIMECNSVLHTSLTLLGLTILHFRASIVVVKLIRMSFLSTSKN